MNVIYDTETRSTYFELNPDAPVLSTAQVSDVVLVDLGFDREPVGVEVLARPGQITDEMLQQIGENFPALRRRLDPRRWDYAIV